MGKVLVVENEKFIHQIINFSLRRKGYEVFQAENGAEGLELYEKVKPVDVILLDLVMPVMDGYEFLKRFRLLDKETHVIMLTSKTSPSDLKISMALGANDYVIKPFEVNSLVKKISLQINKT